MKNKVLKFYIVAVYLFSTVVMFGADPGADNDTGTMEGDGDNTGMPIDDYVYVLAVIGLLFVFIKFRAIYNSKIKG